MRIIKCLINFSFSFQFRAFHFSDLVNSIFDGDRYHVPRSWLNDGVNTLVLFEEFGGNPSQVNFQTVVVGTVCGQAHENKTMELTCHGRPISEIKYASFGDPQGACGAFKKGSCEIDVLPVIEKQCVGQKSCSVEVSEAKLGATSCAAGTVKRLAVEALC